MDKKKFKKTLIKKAKEYGLVLLIFVLVLLLLGKFESPFSKTTEKEPRSLSGSISQIGELATLEYDYTYVGEFKNSREVNLKITKINVPLTEKYFIGAFDGTIKYGINLDEIAEPNISTKEKTITINVPKIVKFSHEIDPDSIRYFDQDNNLFNPIKADDSDKFKTEHMKDAEKEAIQRGVIKKTQDYTKNILTTFIQNSFDEYKNYTVVCKFEKQKTIKKASSIN